MSRSDCKVNDAGDASKAPCNRGAAGSWAGARAPDCVTFVRPRSQARLPIRKRQRCSLLFAASSVRDVNEDGVQRTPTVPKYRGQFDAPPTNAKHEKECLGDTVDVRESAQVLYTWR